MAALVLTPQKVEPWKYATHTDMKVRDAGIFPEQVGVVGMSRHGNKEKITVNLPPRVAAEFREQVPDGERSQYIEDYLVSSLGIDVEEDKDTWLDRVELQGKHPMALVLILEALYKFGGREDQHEPSGVSRQRVHRYLDNCGIYRKEDDVDWAITKVCMQNDLPLDEYRGTIEGDQFTCHCGRKIHPNHVTSDTGGRGHCPHCGFQWLNMDAILEGRGTQ